MSNSPCFPLGPQNTSLPNFIHPHDFRSRKRLWNAVDDEPMTDATSAERDRLAKSEEETKKIIKRSKIEDPVNVSLKRMLESMDKAQLVGLITDATERYPYLDKIFRLVMPKPTIETARAALMAAEKRWMENLPYARGGSPRDAYAYLRVKPMLMEFKITFLEYLDYFMNIQQHLSIRVEFLRICADFLSRLPVWEKPGHNLERGQLYDSLNQAYLQVVKESAEDIRQSGRLYGKEEITYWYRDLQRANEQSTHRLASSLREFEIQLGWMMG